MLTSNVFVRNIPSEIKPDELENKFSEFGNVKSLKVSLNPDHSSRGYGFIQFQEEDAAAAAVQTLSKEKMLQALVYQPRDRRELSKLVNNIYIKNLPAEMSDKEARKLF